MTRTRSALGRTALFAIALAFALAAPRASSADGPRTFPSPEAAAKALAEACEQGDAAAVLGIFGPGAEDLLRTGDEAANAIARRQFAALVRQAVAEEPSADGSTTVLVVGYKKWPFPVPLVKEGSGWRFDVAAAREEILARRIGENELSMIAACEFYAAAQREYASADRDGDGCFEYAQRIRSTPGTKDGLYWDAKEGEAPSPIGPLVAEAGDYGREHKQGDPWKGYFFRILTRQGESAPGGAFNYVSAKGDMIGGFALVAWPADYRKSGVMTFVVGREGKVFQKDLGEKTAEAALAIESFDPDATWKPARDGADGGAPAGK